MFKRSKNNDYQDYVDYNNEDDLIEETREFPVDPRSDWEFNQEQESQQDYGQIYDQADSYPLYEEEVAQNNFDQEDSIEETEEYSLSSRSNSLDKATSGPMRAKYNAKMDRFLNNGIIITGVLLIIVLVIAFMI